MYAPLTLPWLRYERGDATTPTCMILLLLQVHYHRTMGPNPFKKSQIDWFLLPFQFHQIFLILLLQLHYHHTMEPNPFKKSLNNWITPLSMSPDILILLLQVHSALPPHNEAKFFQKRAKIIEFYKLFQFHEILL